MTIFSSIKPFLVFRKIFIFLLVSGCSINYAAAATTGVCTNPKGPNTLMSDIGVVNVSDAQNYAGNTVDPFITWLGNGAYTIQCDCDQSIQAQNGRWAFSAQMYLPESEPGWYRLDESLSVKVRTIITGRNPTEIPFQNIGTANENHWDICRKPETIPGSGSGSSGNMALKIVNPIMGTTSINNVKMAGLWMCYNTPASNNCGFTGEANLDYVFNGTIIAPTNCTINAGQIISVDLGTEFSGNFKSAREKAKGYAPRQVKIPVQCSTGIGATATLQYRISATANSDYDSSIKTSNDGVGILIEDPQGNIIKPNTTEKSFSLSNSKADIEFTVSPVSTTGTFSQSGTYNATATVAVEYD